MATALPKKKDESPTFERYGLQWPRAEANDLSLELACYREPETYKTGKTREFHLRNAFKIIWPEYQWNEWCELMTWAWCNFQIVAVIGHTRGSKTWHFAHMVLVDYLAADFKTATTLTTTKFDALKTRLWGDMMRAVENMRPEVQSAFMARYKITNTTNEMKLSINDPAKFGEDKFLIQGVATDSADKSAGKIRGQHADRRRIVGDEAQDIADAIYMAITNARSAPDFRCGLLSQPIEKISEFGNWCEPEDGWGSIHDTQLFWKTKKSGGVCLHLDGLQSPNIKAGRTIFPYLLTQQYIDEVEKDWGRDSLQWWAYVRGFFPPDGTVAKIWTSDAIEKARAVTVFDLPPTPCATLDPAFDGDNCALHFGLRGKLRNGNPCTHATESMNLKTTVGPNELPKDYQIARQVIALCKARGVQPEDFIQDETGNARGVLAILRVEWSPKVQGISYGGEATDRPLRLNDALKANEQVKYFVAELWFRASFLAREGMLTGLRNVSPRTAEDLSARRYTLKQYGERKLMVAESKDEMKKRLGRSPDDGDAFCGFGELMVRKGLLASIIGGGIKNRWQDARARAVKASSRYDEQREFANSPHGEA